MQCSRWTFTFIACLVMVISSSAVAQDNSYIQDDFDDYGGDAESAAFTSRWYNNNSTLEEQAPGDWALRIQDAASWGNGVVTVDNFSRGANLRCTWCFWHGFMVIQDADGSTEGAQTTNFDSTSLMAPFRMSDQTSNSFQRHEAALEYFFPTDQWQDLGTGPTNGGLNKGIGWSETGAVQSGVQLDAAFQQAGLAAVDKSSAVYVRAWLGDVSGGTAVWSTDGGATWTPIRTKTTGEVIDTRGETIGSVVLTGNDNSNGATEGAMTGSVTVSGNTDVWVGFASGAGILYVDNVLLEDDNNNTIPVNSVGAWTVYQ